MCTRHEGRWKIYVQMRTDGTPETQGKSFQAGLYYPESKKTVSRSYLFSAAAGKDFKIIPIGEYSVELGESYFFCAPAGNSQASPVDVKTLYLARQ